MFSYIKGYLVEKSPVKAVIECANIGYEIQIPLSTFEKLGVIGTETKLFTHLAVSDDGLRLFGFHTHAEKELFLLITNVSGFGPKIGLSILSSMSVTTFLNAVRNDDDKVLTIAPGLGKKKSQRLVLELKDKVASFEALEIAEYEGVGVNKMAAEAETALLTLGYKTSDIRAAFDNIIETEENITSEMLIKLTIQHLYKSSASTKKKG
ncbi:MAG: Holliday junction branch migration protein RuvA [Candidatus Cloacimonas sp.]|nr:Holliday junction branch migration protein RuvA [Candidatus Cloacimonadota bacterium]